MEQRTDPILLSVTGNQIRCTGDWTAPNARQLEQAVNDARSDGAATSIDLTNIGQLDTIGAWLLSRLRHQLGGDTVELVGGTTQHQALLERIGDLELEKLPAKQTDPVYLRPFVRFGKTVLGAGQDVIASNAVMGRLLIAFARTATLRAPLRFPSFVNQFEQIVLRAIPIVALISLVVGAIITQQTILQLKNFGATIFVVDLAAILMFREIGVLLAAIMVAGRSGSAITAEIGAMRLREEVDALKVMGVDPFQSLFLPRVLALVVGMPLLAFVGSMAGLVGAALVARFYGDIPADLFIDRLRGAMSVQSVMVGLVKAPFMAFLVGLLASIEGLKVQGSSESLGRRTTSSVVKSIFVVIVADGLFAIFFAAIGF